MNYTLLATIGAQQGAGSGAGGKCARQWSRASQASRGPAFQRVYNHLSDGGTVCRVLSLHLFFGTVQPGPGWAWAHGGRVHVNACHADVRGQRSRKKTCVETEICALLVAGYPVPVLVVPTSCDLRACLRVLRKGSIYSRLLRVYSQMSVTCHTAVRTLYENE